MFGFFECERRPRGRRRRCSTPPASWLRERGRERILGPMDFTTNDELGILVEGYELRPMILAALAPALLPAS